MYKYMASFHTLLLLFFLSLPPPTHSTSFPMSHLKADESKYQVEAEHHEEQLSVDCEKSVQEIQIEHVPEGTTGAGKALFMLLKAFIGTGVIFLPGS